MASSNFYSLLGQNDLEIQSALKEMEEKLKNIGIPEKHIRSIFLSIDKLALKYGWVSDWGNFTPRDVDDLLNEWSNEKYSLEEQEQLISDYFIQRNSANNFDALESYIGEWCKNPIFEKRIPIFRDCLFALRNSSQQFNSSNLVVPVLISQIDGIFGELLKREGWHYKESLTKKGKKIKKWVYYNDGEIIHSEITSDKGFGTLIKEKRNCLGANRLKHSISNLVQTNSRHEVIIEGLFQSANYGDEIKNLNFISRHKILHGEDMNYGTQKNAIKLFLILNYLSKFSVSKLADPDDNELVEFRTLRSINTDDTN